MLEALVGGEPASGALTLLRHVSKLGQKLGILPLRLDKRRAQRTMDREGLRSKHLPQVPQLGGERLPESHLLFL